MSPTGVLPTLLDLGEDALALVRIAARHCLLPDPATVACFDGAVFPSIRDQKNRITAGEHDGRAILLDDNVTARWALLWSHGISATHHPKGWTFAHVWPTVKDPDAYTHLANLVMMPEYLASLSDKQGPLTRYLQFHAWSRYSWKPSGFEPPAEPEAFDGIDWRYLPTCFDPSSFVRRRLAELNNQRAILLRPMMGLVDASNESWTPDRVRGDG